MLEAAQWSDNAFLTLTYDDEHLPIINKEERIASLAPKHLQDFLKRLRNVHMPAHLRFYACGEYGDENFRPHYHVALFNFPTCRRFRTYRKPGSSRPLFARCCDICRLVGDTWGHGDIDLGVLEENSAQYVAGYVTKKMTHRHDSRLLGREPEFSRMSRRPGIAADAMHEVASELMRFNLEQTQADVPSALRHGSRQLPLGRYLKNKLRSYVGKEEKAPEVVIEALKEEMRPLREAAKNSSDAPSLKHQVILKGTNGRLRLEQKQRLYQRKKHL